MKNYYKYIKLSNKRMMREKIELSFKNFLDFFIHDDKQRIVSTILILHKFSTIFIINFNFLLFFSFSMLYGTALSIYLIGVINLVLSVVLIFLKFKTDKIEILKKELIFIVQQTNYDLKKAVVIKISFEIFKSIFLFNVIPFLITVIFLAILLSYSFNILITGLLFCILNFVMCLGLVHLKIIYSSGRKLISYLMPFFLFVFITLALLINLYNYNSFDTSTLVDNVFTIDRTMLQSTEAYICATLLMIFVGFSIVKLNFHINSNNYIKDILVAADNREFITPSKAKKYSVYSRLALRAFSINNKIFILKTISVSLSLVLIAIHPLISNYESAINISTVLIFCYTPSIILLSYTFVLFTDFMPKQSIYTNFYLQKKYNYKKKFSKEIFFLTLRKIAFFLILPQVVFLIFYQPFNPFLGIFCNLIVCVALTKILILRTFNTDKYSIEQIIQIEASVLTTKTFEDTLIFGIPVLYAFPLVIIYTLQNINMYIIYIPYTIFVLTYCAIKCSTFYLGRNVYDVRNKKPS